MAERRREIPRSRQKHAWEWKRSPPHNWFIPRNSISLETKGKRNKT